METSWWEADSLLPLCGTLWALSLLFWQCLANIPSHGLLPCAPPHQITYFWQWIWKMSCQGKCVSKTSCYPTYTKAPPAC